MRSGELHFPSQSRRLHRSLGDRSCVGLSRRSLTTGDSNLHRLNTGAHREGGTNHQVTTLLYGTSSEFESIHILFPYSRQTTMANLASITSAQQLGASRDPLAPSLTPLPNPALSHKPSPTGPTIGDWESDGSPTLGQLRGPRTANHLARTLVLSWRLQHPDSAVVLGTIRHPVDSRFSGLTTSHTTARKRRRCVACASFTANTRSSWSSCLTTSKSSGRAGTRRHE